MTAGGRNSANAPRFDRPHYRRGRVRRLREFGCLAASARAVEDSRVAWIVARKHAPPTRSTRCWRAGRGRGRDLSRGSPPTAFRRRRHVISRVTTTSRSGSREHRHSAAFRMRPMTPSGSIGFVNSSRGSTAPANVMLPSPVHVHRRPVPRARYLYEPALRSCAAAPYTLVAEREMPPPPGVTPSPTPTQPTICNTSAPIG